jgi:hypothetical protein
LPALRTRNRRLPVLGKEIQMQETKINQERTPPPPGAVSLRSIQAIIEDLSKPIADRHVKTRKQATKDITYISWDTAVRYLDHYAPGWSFEIRSVFTLGHRCVVTVRISIPALEGIVYREATGTEDEELKGYGDPSSNAEAMALKRAAAKFGLGLYLYQK